MPIYLLPEVTMKAQGIPGFFAILPYGVVAYDYIAKK
jgi:hypothetical protein